MAETTTTSARNDNVFLRRLSQEENERIEQKFANLNDDDLLLQMRALRVAINEQVRQDRENGITSPHTSTRTADLVLESNEIYYALHQRGIYERYRQLEEHYQLMGSELLKATSQGILSDLSTPSDLRKEAQEYAVLAQRRVDEIVARQS